MGKLIKEWKKVYLEDLPYVSKEICEGVTFPALLLLSGEMGAGKTTLCQHLAPAGKLASPTYAMIQEYGDLAHADFFRIESADELMCLEMELYLEDKNLFIVEWGKRWISQLQRIIDDSFGFYELEISSNNDPRPSRNYTLHSLDR